jgi:valyl-tRNA synthetase
VTDPATCAHCGRGRIQQDPDVLDTWFSSGLWPFSTLGWPDPTEDLKTFYPTTVMETGYDILFFWVARMIMLGLEMTGDIPFSVVYLHGLVRDEFGRKYSKSLGNALDPIDVIEEFGTDALRFSLVTSSTPGEDAKLAPAKVEAARNFANKIWQAARFVLSNLGEEPPALSEPAGGSLTLADRWIISRHNRLITDVNRLMADYQFGEAGRQIRDFLWSEFCDWYIEITKNRLYGTDPQARQSARQVLVYVMERTLRLLHPFMPFVTEEIWQHLPHPGEALIVAAWPEAGAVDEAIEKDMELVMDIVRAIRNARSEYNVEAGHPVEAIIAAGEQATLLEDQRALLISLARVNEATLAIAGLLAEKPQQALALVIGGVEVYLPLAGLVDLDAERQRLTKEIKETEEAIARSEGLLSREGFRDKAPAQVVAREEERLADHRVRVEKLQARLKTLGGE